MGERCITLLTDFGTRDGYVAAMKGVIASLAPRARVVDATHDIPAHDIRAGAWSLMQYWKFFPRGTIHVAVVDPGVGTERRPLLVEADGHFFLGPDNGIFAWIPARRIHEVRARRAVVSNTFHGRDVFAHAAGLLAAGRRVSGAEVRDPVIPSWVAPRRERGRVIGEVVHIDHFGNCITNLKPEPGPIVVGRRRIAALARTYGEAARGKPIALVGSSGYVEIALRERSAAAVLGLKRGDRIILETAHA